MNTDDLMILLVVVGFVLVLIDSFYLTWFKPSRFLERSRNVVRDWWPFADYFRSFYSSLIWLWIIRIVTAVLMLGLLYGVYQVISSLFKTQL